MALVALASGGCGSGGTSLTGDATPTDRTTADGGTRPAGDAGVSDVTDAQGPDATSAARDTLGTGGETGSGPASAEGPHAGGPGLVSTMEGLVQGVSAGALYVYKGIPYAEPPVGLLRWRPPVPTPPRGDTLVADAWGSACSQRDAQGQLSGTEDCLTLNVWAPTTDAPATGLPVMFFIHGGSHVRGAASATRSEVELYDGAQLAALGGVVVVTLNYRVGALGFMAHPSLAAESVHGASGNYGILGQMLALEWTHANITAFGGDKGNITVFGQSAGAYDSCILRTPTMRTPHWMMIGR